MDTLRRRRLTACLSAGSLALLAACSSGPQNSSSSPPATSGPATWSSTSPAPTSGPATPGGASSAAPGTGLPTGPPQTVATGLDVPWGLAFLPDGSALVTLRDRGQVVQLRSGQAPRTVATIGAVRPEGEAGLLGIAVSPTFATDRRVFVYYTAADDNRIERFTWDGTALRPDRVVLSGIPKASVHNGGRLAFGPDRQLYVGTGDAGETSRSQDRSSLGGKILRIDQEGRPPAGNPFPGSPVWSLGHRNVQGLAWDADGRMFATEFGQDTFDELNQIRAGQNYGWPTVEGRGGRSGLVDPLVTWTTDEASPSGLAIGGDGAAYVAALRGERVWRVPLTDGRPGTPEEADTPDLGRVRTIAVAPDGRLWLMSSNTFRGDPRDGDDRIVSWIPA